ncbi:MAG TPA: carbon monoxide dehydrogenase subunit G [Polyangiaceae bacterium]|nr:carbon monoxide dehydrogenase subunit G [Polyangiaceae bacterium]
MKMQGTYTFEAPLETVWNALFDAEVLARTLPGCEKLEREGNQFRGDINVKMGPVQGKFQGKVDITDIKERESYTMVVDGRGPAGFGKATAQMRVQPEGTGTRLDYDSDVTVGGKIASVGQRLIDASSRAIVKQSLEGLHEQIKALAARPAAVPAAAPAVPAPAAAAPAISSPDEPSASLDAVAGAPTSAEAAPARSTEPGASRPDNAWFEGAARPLPTPAGSPAAAMTGRPARGPSQAAFALGVAREVTKELFPMKKVLLGVGLLVLAFLIYRLVSS